MTKKLDIMNNSEPGKWAIIDGKVQRIEEFIEPAIVEEKVEKELQEKVLKEEVKKVEEVIKDTTKDERVTKEITKKEMDTIFKKKKKGRRRYGKKF